MPLIDTDGKTLGILSAIDTRPIDENKRLLALLPFLSIFSARGAAELEVPSVPSSWKRSCACAPSRCWRRRPT